MTSTQAAGTASLPWIGNNGSVTNTGSYFFNGWLYTQSTIGSPGSVGTGGLFGKQDNIKHPTETPLFADGRWEDGWPNGGSAAGAGDASITDLYNNGGSLNPMMSRVCIARHGIKNPAAAPQNAATTAPYPGGVNVAQSDGHVEYAKLDTLWSAYYWHALSVPQKRP